MYKISLVNMPFANLKLPSIALTQLRAVAEQGFGERVRVRILYLNHEFAHYLGLDLYQGIAGALSANNSGLGDWLFRRGRVPAAGRQRGRSTSSATSRPRTAAGSSTGSCW